MGNEVAQCSSSAAAASSSISRRAGSCVCVRGVRVLRARVEARVFGVCCCVKLEA